MEANMYRPYVDFAVPTPPTPAASTTTTKPVNETTATGGDNDSSTNAKRHTLIRTNSEVETSSRCLLVEQHLSLAGSARVPSVMSDQGARAGGNADEEAYVNVEEVNETLEERRSVDSESGPELKHFTIDPPPEILDGTPSGWAAVAKSIRENDEQKIQDYKEDIDTILVFAGLYAAVLSALIVESLQSLQPDPNDIMIALLSQIVAQTHTYSINDGYLNSTAALFDPGSIQPQNFTPSLAAKRVNVLWFASLTLSLISASFGILVKQWLREYLSGEYVSPQAQLRIRHFRKPGLEHWHVFAIAAFLPLVLQLALALFFVGLCFFTLDIHNSIGYTTVPLVAAWAFLFVAVSFAPALSPRCPYKLPVFKEVNTLVRAALSCIIRLFKGMPTLPPKSEWKIKPYWTWLSLHYNEEDAANDPQSDVDILVSIDATQTDDQLVMKMCSALKEKHTTPDVNVDFVIKLISFRLGTTFETRPLSLMLDLSQLPVQTSTILMDSVADVLAREVRKFPVSEPIEWTDLTRDCVSLLSARLPCLLSDKAMAVVSLCFTGTQDLRPEDTFEMMFKNVRPKDRHALCLHLQQRLRHALFQLDAWQFYMALSAMMRKSCCRCSQCVAIWQILETHTDTMPPILREHTCEVIIGYMLIQVKTGAVWCVWHREIMLTLYRQWADAESVPWYRMLKELTDLLITKPEFAPYFLCQLFHKSYFDVNVQRLFCDIFPLSNEPEQILSNMYSAFVAYLHEALKIPALLDDSFYLNILRFTNGQFSPMSYLVNNHYRSLVELRYLPLYQKIWNEMLIVLRHFDPATKTEEQTLLANTCLENIDMLDETWLPPTYVGAHATYYFERWCKVFPAAQSFFHDDLIEGLMNFLPSLEDVQYNRVRRISWKRKQRRKAQVDSAKQESRDHVDESDGDDASANAVDQDETEHADGITDNVSNTFSPVVVVPPSVFGGMHAIPDGTTFDHTFPHDDPAVPIPMNSGHNIAPEILEAGRLVSEVQGAMVHGDTERTLQ